jgi:hypothetical protein
MGLVIAGSFRLSLRLLAVRQTAVCTTSSLVVSAHGVGCNLAKLQIWYTLTRFVHIDERQLHWQLDTPRSSLGPGIMVLGVLVLVFGHLYEGLASERSGMQDGLIMRLLARQTRLEAPVGLKKGVLSIGRHRDRTNMFR